MLAVYSTTASGSLQNAKCKKKITILNFNFQFVNFNCSKFQNTSEQIWVVFDQILWIINDKWEGLF